MGAHNDIVSGVRDCSVNASYRLLNRSLLERNRLRLCVETKHPAQGKYAGKEKDASQWENSVQEFSLWFSLILSWQALINPISYERTSICLYPPIFIQRVCSPAAKYDKVVVAMGDTEASGTDPLAPRKREARLPQLVSIVAFAMELSSLCRPPLPQGQRSSRATPHLPVWVTFWSDTIHALPGRNEFFA